MAGGDEMVEEKECYRSLANIDFEWPVEWPVGEWPVELDHLIRRGLDEPPSPPQLAIISGRPWVGFHGRPKSAHSSS